MENNSTNDPKRAISDKGVSLSLSQAISVSQRLIQVLLLFIFSSVIASAQQVEVTLEEAGTLSSKIESDQKLKITSLKVSGPINGTDVRYLREMAGRDYKGYSTTGSLVELDLTDANIIRGGDYYYYYTTSSHCDTWDNTLGSFMFCDCKLKDIKLPNSVTSIGNSSFNGCTGLTSITIPNSVTSIEDGSFSGCTGLTSITIPNSVTSIEKWAFSGCTGLTSITIPNSVTSIGEYAFRRCARLTSIIIPSSVTSIGGYAFDSFQKKVIMLPNSVPSLMSYAFPNDWEGMIYVANNNYSSSYGKGTVKVYPYLSSLFEVDGVIYVPVNPSQRTCDVIDCNYNDTTSGIVVPQAVSYKGVTMYPLNVNDYSFVNCRRSGNVTLSNNGYIGSHAFEGCQKLTSANIFGKFTSLGNYCFQNCTSLSGITLTDSMTTIGEYAFASSGLKSFTFPTELTSLGSCAFSNCKNLESVNINGKLTKLNSSMFSGCSSLSGISIPANLKSISDNTFDGCTSLSTLIIENDTDTLALGNNGKSPLFADCPLDSVYVGTHISYKTSSDYSYSPFYRNKTLRAVCLGDNVSKVYDNEFYGCTGLKKAIIGEGVTKIGNYAFSGCSSMKSFLFGKNVQTIGDEAFSDCTALTRLISHSATPPTCGTEALDDINKWNCTLIVPKESLTLYRNAEQWKEFFFVEDLTGISQIENNNADTVVRRYDTNGRLLTKPVPGLNILKMSNGTTKKVLVK